MKKEKNKAEAAENAAQHLIDTLTTSWQAIIKEWRENDVYFLLKQIFTAIELAGRQQPKSPRTKKPYTWEEIERGNLYKIVRDYKGVVVAKLLKLK